jgi:hypothetical protein
MTRRDIRIRKVRAERQRANEGEIVKNEKYEKEIRQEKRR